MSEREWTFTHEGFDGPNATIKEREFNGRPMALLIFHADDGPGDEDWTANIDADEGPWIRDRLIEIFGMPPEDSREST